MAHYIEFSTPDGPIFVEADIEESLAGAGRQRAGFAEDVVNTTTSKAQASFQSALRVVRQNAAAFIGEMQGMMPAPDAVEVTFSLKATGELSNLAIGKIGGESNYSVTVKWKSKPDSAE